jgi:hypothetical protein
LKETEEELLNVLEKYNSRDEEMNFEDRTKYKELNEMKEKLEGKIERIAFLVFQSILRQNTNSKIY